MKWDTDTPEGLANAVEWMKQHVARIADGGTWLIPRSGSIVKIDHQNKRATRIAGLLPEPSTQKVFEAMGWTWVDES
jgi:hypothetical protein